jgi:hypothetical protein
LTATILGNGNLEKNMAKIIVMSLRKDCKMNFLNPKLHYITSNIL